MEMREGRRGGGCRGGGSLGVRGQPHARGTPRVRREALEPRGVAPSGRVCERSSQEPADRGAEGPGERRVGSRAGGLGGFGRIRSNP